MQTLIKEKVLTIIWEEKHFKVKNITGDKDHFIMVKGSIYWVRLYQNVHVSNNRASEYMN